MESHPTHAGPTAIQHAIKKRLIWSKVHLIYFALASFDVLAIIAGLGLADFTKGKFEDAVHSFQLGDLLRDNTSAVMEAVIALSGPANDIFETGDTAKARKDLQVASDAFDVALANDHYDAHTKEVMDAAVAAAGGSKSAYRRGGLALLYPQI